MPDNRISMDYFKNATHHYHIYKIRYSKAAESFHSHDFYQICYILNGEIVHKQASDEVHLMKGDAFIIPPNVTHSIQSCSTAAEYYSVSFQEALFYPGFSISGANSFITALKLDYAADKLDPIHLKMSLDPDARLSIEALLDCLLREFRLDLPRNTTMAGSLVASILIVLSRIYFSDPDMKKQYDDITGYHAAMIACIKYININYMEPLTLPEIAHKFALSVSTFGIMFPQIAGMSFKRYINEKRIENAVSLLAVKSLSNYEIAQIVGYRDTSTYYRNFVKITGVSPTEYIKTPHDADS